MVICVVEQHESETKESNNTRKRGKTLSIKEKKLKVFLKNLVSNRCATHEIGGL